MSHNRSRRRSNYRATPESVAVSEQPRARWECLGSHKPVAPEAITRDAHGWPEAPCPECGWLQWVDERGEGRYRFYRHSRPLGVEEIAR